MTAEQQTTWTWRIVAWTSGAIASHWVTLGHSYQLLVILSCSEWVVSGALLVKQKGLVAWCPYEALWGILSKFVIFLMVFCFHELSDIFSGHLEKPIDVAPAVALGFTIQQLMTIIKKSKGLNVDPPPIVDALLKVAERLLQQKEGIVFQEKTVTTSPSGEIVTGEKVTTIRVAEKQTESTLIIPPSDIVKPQ